MPKQPKLSDMQLVLLSTASQREDGNFFPIRGFPEGRREPHRQGDRRPDQARLRCRDRGRPEGADTGAKTATAASALTITSRGPDAIGGRAKAVSGSRAAKRPPRLRRLPAPPTRKAGEIRAGTKQALLVEMLEREEGASIQQIVDADRLAPAHRASGADRPQEAGLHNHQREGGGRPPLPRDERRRLMDATLEEELAALATMSPAQLRDQMAARLSRAGAAVRAGPPGPRHRLPAAGEGVRRTFRRPRGARSSACCASTRRTARSVTERLRHD